MDADLVLTEAERARCNEIMRRIERLQALLAAEMLGSPDNPAAWYKYLAATKQIQGNLSNDISFLACLMAKRYLAQQHGVSGFDASTKAQGAPGLDIDVRTLDGRRVIAEIKTTDPYLPVDFGAQQKQKFREDFANAQEGPRRSEIPLRHGGADLSDPLGQVRSRDSRRAHRPLERVRRYHRGAAWRRGERCPCPGGAEEDAHTKH